MVLEVCGWDESWGGARYSQDPQLPVASVMGNLTRRGMEHPMVLKSFMLTFNWAITTTARVT